MCLMFVDQLREITLRQHLKGLQSPDFQEIRRHGSSEDRLLLLASKKYRETENWGKYVAEFEKQESSSLVRNINIEEVALAYDKTVIEMRGVDALTNILKPPPREINFMNPPSSSLDDARV
ncbi:hypothetical protein HAX54_036983 [Datura stramonium]|uniref:Uncharacterized protein n=1 Tax=Datura stramonium TaxID=4076 RepID=A0ABS8VLL7_DATST|nr:hypothetical protein [Datura stramonium]